MSDLDNLIAQAEHNGALQERLNVIERLEALQAEYLKYGSYIGVAAIAAALTAIQGENK